MWQVYLGAEAVHAARRRTAMETLKLPVVISNLHNARGCTERKKLKRRTRDFPNVGRRVY